MGKRARGLTADARRMYHPNAALANRINAALTGIPLDAPVGSGGVQSTAPALGSVAAPASRSHPEAQSSGANFVPGRLDAPVVSAPERASLPTAFAASVSEEC